MSDGNQDIATPWRFFRAVEKLFSIQFIYDMAANAENAKCFIYFTEKDDSLKIDWPLDGWCWLNPPFRKQTPFIKKCKEQMDRGCRIVTIWPLSGDQNQIATWVNTDVYVVHGRVWQEVRGVMLCRWTRMARHVSGLFWDKEKLERLW